MTEIRGMEEIIAKLDKKLGPERCKKVVNKALKRAGDECEDDLKDMAESFRDRGVTVEETTHSNVSWADYGIPTVKVGWRSGSRWRMEHLQEFGYTRFGKSYNPRGVGKMRNLVDTYQSKYPEIAQEELKELLQ